MIRAMSILLAAGLMVSGCSGKSQKVWLVDLEGKSAEIKAAVFCAQGIANRKDARVFVRLGDDCRWMQMDYEKVWDSGDAEAKKKLGIRTIEDAWIRYLGRTRCQFETVTPEELFTLLKDEIKGGVLYESIREDCAPAFTWAGLLDAVPVTTNNSFGLEIIADYTQIKKTLPDDKLLAGHAWMIENLLAKCQKNGAVSRARLYNRDAHDTLVDIDLAVQNRWAIYSLDHSDKKDLPDRTLIDRILSTLDPFSAVYGWGIPGEDAFIRTLNRNKLVGACSGVPNNSFFAKLKPIEPLEFKQKRTHVRPQDVTVENKLYVAFMVNEGDSIKTMNAFQGFGAWLQKERGTIPINWGIAPNNCEAFPGLMQIYYESATANDYFFAPPSGWGYTHPGFLPEDLLMTYADKVRDGMVFADLKFIDIWWLGELRKRDVFNPFLKRLGVWGLTDWDNSRQEIQFSPDGIPIAKSHHYYTYKGDPAKFAEKFLEETEHIQTPWFCIIYGSGDHGSPHRFSELAKRLPTDRVKIVLLDEFFAAAVNARAVIENRRLLPGKGIEKGVAP